jgi:hypothetical protein
MASATAAAIAAAPPTVAAASAAITTANAAATAAAAVPTPRGWVRETTSPSRQVGQSAVRQQDCSSWRQLGA